MVRAKEERKEENKKLMKYLSEKCETADEPLNVANIVKEFIDKEGTNTPFGTLNWTAHTYKNEEVYKITNKETMVRELFFLGARVNKDLLKILKGEARVTLDKQERIIYYTANDESLILRGDHSSKRKQLETFEERRRSQMTAAENGEEKEENDGAVDPEPQPPVPKKPRVGDPVPANQGKEQMPEENVGVLGVDVKQEEPEVFPFIPDDGKPEILSNSDASKPVLSLSNHQSFLQQTKALISTMKLPVDKRMENRITGMIDRIQFRRQNIQQIEIYFFEGTIRHAISLALTNTSKVIQEKDSRSFVQFVLLLQMSIVGLNEPKLKELEDTLHDICQNSEYQQKKISVSSIEKALEAILDILAPN